MKKALWPLSENRFDLERKNLLKCCVEASKLSKNLIKSSENIWSSHCAQRSKICREMLWVGGSHFIYKAIDEIKIGRIEHIKSCSYSRFTKSESITETLISSTNSQRNLWVQKNWERFIQHNSLEQHFSLGVVMGGIDCVLKNNMKSQVKFLSDSIHKTVNSLKDPEKYLNLSGSERHSLTQGDETKNVLLLT